LPKKKNKKNLFMKENKKSNQKLARERIVNENI